MTDEVFGSHTYEKAGTYQIDVSLTENGVFCSSEAPYFTIVAGNQGTGNQGTGNQGADTPNQAFVTNVYHDLLNRAADAAGLAYWSSQLDAGLADSQFVADIEASGEYRDDVVTSLYEKYLHRAAEPAALAADSQLLAQGTTRERLAAMIVGSNEYFSLHGSTADGFLSGLFQDALGRPIDTGTKTAFEAALASGESRAQLAAIVFGSLEYHADVVENTYVELLGRSAESSGQAYWAGQLGNGLSDEELMALIASSSEYFSKRS